MKDSDRLSRTLQLGRKLLAMVRRLDPTDTELAEIEQILDECDEAVDEMKKLETDDED